MVMIVFFAVCGLQHCELFPRIYARESRSHESVPTLLSWVGPLTEHEAGEPLVRVSRTMIIIMMIIILLMLLQPLRLSAGGVPQQPPRLLPRAHPPSLRYQA